LIGFKQLLNFGAWSVPGTGGFIFTGVGVVLVVLAWLELRRKTNRFTNVRTVLTTAAIITMVVATSCSTAPQPIQFGKDALAVRSSPEKERCISLMTYTA
jgi:copper chaperone NosL